uniref:uncharacterized protein LOC118539965 n=1 Tax=Halichoerus grypus TaxID=9711 RepID=UPI001658E95E|nr:uncharacterized protein LOC118539965 [Halichoerus grypus]
MTPALEPELLGYTVTREKTVFLADSESANPQPGRRDASGSWVDSVGGSPLEAGRAPPRAWSCPFPRGPFRPNSGRDPTGTARPGPPRRLQRCLKLNPSTLNLLGRPPSSIVPGSHLSCAGEGFCHLSVPPSVAGSDEVSNTAALQEGGTGHRATAEELGKADHLHESQSDHCCLGVVAKAQPVTEASAHGHYILWRVEVTGEKGSLPAGPSAPTSRSFHQPRHATELSEAQWVGSSTISTS